MTLDDDLQNPPEEALVLIDRQCTAGTSCSAVDRKQAAGYRHAGSHLISMINRRVFGQPPGLTVSNFRILRRSVVDRIAAPGPRTPTSPVRR